MAIVDYGETYSSPTFEVRDTAGVLGNAGTVTYVLTFPDGTTASGTVPSTGTGTYALDFTPAGAQQQDGTHVLVVTATGGVLGALVRKWVETYVVDSEAPLVSTRDVVAHLRAEGLVVGAAQLELVRFYALATTDAVARDLGRKLARTTVVERHDGGRDALAIRSTPVVSVTSIVESGTTLTGGADVDYVLDQSAGLLYRGTPTSSWCWARGRQNVVLTLVVGMVDPPVFLRKVILNGVARVWQQWQQAGHPMVDDVGADAAVFDVVESLPPVERAAYESLRQWGIA